jgi:excisionase family DNA binding protein
MKRGLDAFVPNPKDLTIESAAKLLKVHPNTVRRWIMDGELATYRWGKGGRHMIRRDTLARYLESRQTGTRPTSKRSA